MHWLLPVILSLTSSMVHAIGAADVPGRKLQLATAEVVGSVFCDICLQHQFSKTSHFISGASVSVECPNGISSDAKTDEKGRFKARLPFSVGEENANQIRDCTVRLKSSGDPRCSVLSTESSSSLQLKSSKEGVYTFSVGSLAFQPLKLPRFCRKLKAEKIATVDRSTLFPCPDSGEEGKTSSLPEFFFAPFPFQPPPFFPPIPGFTPPPFIPLPPIPGFTPPPSPLIPIPPIPGFTPPPSPPFFHLPPIPFPGFTPPPPPPLFYLPPIPGFTPPSPPPAPFFHIPFPPFSIPGFAPPPPPPPPPPPAFPFPLPPFSPLPPFPGTPPASPSSLDQSRTNP
ncbi:hypothetical protein SAY87_022791 [Trapa incisa]|uniref:Uncharacterized protein n=1 Tax=Trapa incisa TaxID=236973 RepID=A0AAN7K2X1_9MYRT|nr:hypothetical protein SAY87_022791 [Trapa incisa]